jgi:lipopolysaccharide export system protein LptC
MDIQTLLQPPDLPPPTPTLARPRQSWRWHVGQALSSYLPLLLMSLLALATWWLVQNTPGPDAPASTAAPRHEADYMMQGFTMQRFGADGRLRVQMNGEQMRHYADTDTLEIDVVTIRAQSPDGSVMRASARRALAKGDASEVQLLGGAHVVYEGAKDQPMIEFDSEFLHAFLDKKTLRSHLPVRLSQDRSELNVGAIDYNHQTRTARLGAPVRARFVAPRP